MSRDEVRLIIGPNGYQSTVDRIIVRWGVGRDTVIYLLFRPKNNPRLEVATQAVQVDGQTKILELDLPSQEHARKAREALARRFIVSNYWEMYIRVRTAGIFRNHLDNKSVEKAASRWLKLGPIEQTAFGNKLRADFKNLPDSYWADFYGLPVSLMQTIKPLGGPRGAIAHLSKFSPAQQERIMEALITQNRDKDRYICDPIEDTPEYRRAMDRIEAELHELPSLPYGNTTRYWSKKKELLKEQGIDWLSPMDISPVLELICDL
jgi:hypothetical protein